MIEDDFDASAIFATALEVENMTCEIIHSGDQAIERIQQVVPKLILLDLHLPHIDGTKILDEIRNDPRLESVLVIVTTADARMAETIETKADLVLLKPVTFRQIRDLSQRLIRAHAK
ncbi:MAG: response regulator [Anaerolineae bacterium]|nr:response regulator [Anaerolineae bacterium]